MKPKFSIFNYKNILDRCFVRFVQEHDSSFVKSESGDYILSKSVSESTLKKIFIGYLKDELGPRISEYRNSRPEFSFIVGECAPAENAAFLVMGNAPKVRKIVELFPDVTYFPKETDIKLDMRMFNSVFNAIFSKFMKERRKTWKNAFFVRHRHLDFQVMWRFLSDRFGSMAQNPYEAAGEGRDVALWSLNDLIESVSPLMDVTIENGWLDGKKTEVYQYIDTCLNGDF